MKYNVGRFDDLSREKNDDYDGSNDEDSHPLLFSSILLGVLAGRCLLRRGGCLEVLIRWEGLCLFVCIL